MSGGSASLKTMAGHRRRRKITGGKAAVISQSVEDNAFHLSDTAVFQNRIVAVIYRGFPQRLHHRVPHWVEPGALFHIRIGLEREKEPKGANGSSSAGEQSWIRQSLMKPRCDGTSRSFS